MQGISRNIALARINQRQRGGKGRNFIGRVRHHHLPKDNPLLYRPNTYQAKVCKIIRHIHGMMQFFPVKRKMLARNMRETRFHPTNEALL